MTVILIAATVVAPIISALVNVVKEQFGLNGKLVSGLAILIGVLVGLAYSFTIIHGQYAEYCWGGLIAGLSAIGYYEIAFKKEKEGKEGKEGNDEK